MEGKGERKEGGKRGRRGVGEGERGREGEEGFISHILLG